MSGFYTFDLTGDSPGEEPMTEDDDDALDTAFQPELQKRTPQKKRISTASEGVKTPSKRKKTPNKSRASVRSSGRKSASREKKDAPNVFDGLSREIESELLRCGDFSDSPSSDEDTPLPGEEILLVVQNKDQKRVHVRTMTLAPFRHLFEKYRLHAEEKGWIEIGAKLLFFLDDERISPSETPDSRDCEKDDIIDVIIASS